MIERIKTFWQSICSFLNKRGILKKSYRCCAILILGTTVVAVASFCNKEFGGKNNVTATSLHSGGEEEAEEAGEEETGELLVEEAQSEESQSAETQSKESESAETQSEETQLEEVQSETAAAETETIQPEEQQTEQAEIESRAVETVTQENASMAVHVTAEEYEILTRIVEAEAGTEDVKGKMLIANVVLNRVAYSEFPNNIKDVVFQKKGKRYQFSPIKDGRYYDVEVQDSTRIAVDRVLAGEDESMGALFFCERAKSSSSNLKWFDSQLELIFIYGCHEFFVYKQ